MFNFILFCYLLVLMFVFVDFVLDKECNCVKIIVEVKVSGKIGVEMEVFIVVIVSVFMVYDMVKVVDWGMMIFNVWFVFKEGGKFGIYKVSEISLWLVWKRFLNGFLCCWCFLVVRWLGFWLV